MPFFKELESLYQKIDNQYTRTAAGYGFVCSGCEENCCLTRFYHHTLLEYLHILDGVDQMTAEMKEKILIRAETVNLKSNEADRKDETIRLMCPLNQGGLCILYHRRPLICRLHGIPHLLERPGKGVLKGPGCREFEICCNDRNDIRLDRTPFYRQMAQLEKRLRSALLFQGKIKLTIAQMLVPERNDRCNP